MYSEMNGQHQQAGPPLMSSHGATPLTHHTMRNHQAGTANNLYLYRTVSTEAQPPQTTHFVAQDGAYSNKQMSNWKTSALHQAGSAQQPAGGTNNNNLNILVSNPLPSSNMPSGNSYMLVSNGSQVSTMRNFYQNSAQKSKTQTPPNRMTTYPQQDKSAFWNQPVIVNGKQSVRTRGGNVVSDFQQCSSQKSLYQNVNGKSTENYRGYITKPTSQPPKQVGYTYTFMSATAHNTQTDQIQNQRQNVSQLRFSPSNTPPGYNTAVSQSFRNNSITANSLSGEQVRHMLHMTQKTQQHSVQLNSAHNNGGEATASINSNLNSCRYEDSHFVQKKNELPSNDDTQDEMHRRQMIARIEDNLRNYNTAGSGGCRSVHSSSSYTLRHFVSQVRQTQSNQTVQPVTSTAAQICNSNAVQLLLLDSGQSLPNTAQSVTSRAQHIAPPQQSSAPGVYGTTTTEGSGNGSGAGNAFFPKNDRVLNGNLAASDASQGTHLPETQMSVVSGQEKLEKLSLVKQSDSSIHSSPGRAGMRAVAVVPPLSQESCQVAHKHTSYNTISQSGECTPADVSLSDPERLISPTVAKHNFAANLRERCNVTPENPDHMRSSNSVIGHSAASSDDTAVSYSGSAGPRGLSQKQLCAKDKGSELATNMQVERHIAPAAQQSVSDKVPASQNGNMNKSEMSADPQECVFDLSSVPTIPWTVGSLNNLILEAEKAQLYIQNTEDVAEFNIVGKLLNMFWDGSIKTFVHQLKTGWYRDLITDVKEFCSKHITPDCVILSQVKQGSLKQLHSCRVLKDNDVYSELPYRSLWLNVNEQVDDIDKEFGFPRSLTHRLHTFEKGSKSDQVLEVNSIPAQTPNKVLPQTELEPVESGEEKQASTETQTSSPDKTGSADSTDPCYSFKIQVLAPEEAKVIFEQLHSKIPQSEDADSLPEKVVKSPVKDELPDVRGVTLSDLELHNKGVSQIHQICCLSKWIEQIVGSDETSLSKCNCKTARSHKDCTVKPLDKEEMTEEKTDKLCVIKSESKSHCAINGENQGKAGEDADSQILTCILPDLSRQTIDLTEDDEEPHSHSDKETKNVSHISLNDSQSSVIVISENEDENLSSSESEIPKLIPECIQDQLKSTGNSQSSNSDNSETGIEKVFTSEIASHMSDPGEDCTQAQLTSTDVESSLETGEVQTQISARATVQTTFSLSGKHESVERKRKTPSGHEGILPSMKKSKKCRQSVNLDSQPVVKGVKRKRGFVDAADGDTSASKVKTVELVLFGSADQRKSNVAQRPPEVLSVDINPCREKSSVPTVEYSAKQRIYEQWWRSYPQPKINHRKKPKKEHKGTAETLSQVSLKKVETASPINTKELPVSSDVRIWNKNTKSYLSWTRRKTERPEPGQEKRKKKAVTLKQRDQEGSNADNESHAIMPLKENNVLKFSVLPNTFSFAEGSKRMKKTTHPVSDNSDLGEEKEKILHKTTTSPTGIWCPRPQKYCPLRSPSVPTTTAVFQEYRKKYMKKTQSSTTK